MNYNKFIKWFSDRIVKVVGFSDVTSRQMAHAFFSIFVLVGDAMNEYEDICKSEKLNKENNSNDN